VSIIKRTKSFWTLIFILSILFFIIKFLGPHFVKNLYADESIELLNRLTGSISRQSLNYYIGEMEVRVYGPLSMLMAGMVFLLICLNFLNHVNTRKFGLAVFVFLLITKIEVLLFPPYGDAASGPFMEAVWLLKHSFDYKALAQQPAFVFGGPKVYLFSLYPSYQALLMKVFSNVKLFLVVNHLLVFIFSATAVALFREILLKIYNHKVSMLVTLLFLALPLFQSQSEILNMEMPLLLFVMLTIYYMVNKNILMASLCSILAAMIKGVAIYLCGCVFLVSLLLFIFDKDHRLRFLTLFWGLLAILFVSLKMYAVFYILNDRGRVAMVGALEGWFWMKKLEVFYIYLASLILFIGIFIKQRFDKTLRVTFGSFFRRHYVETALFLCTAGWFALFVNSYGDQIRYRLILMPGIIFCLFYVFARLVRSRKVVHGMVTLGIGFSLICSYGLLYKPLNENADSIFERSLEYRNDLKLDMLISEKAQENYQHVTIGAPFTTAHILNFPELGYVTKDLDVMIYGYPCTYGGIKNFKGLKTIDIAKTVWIGLEVALPKGIVFNKGYPINEYDRVLEEITVGPRKASFFMGGGSIEKMRIVTNEALKRMAKKGMLDSINQYRPLQ